MTSWNEYVTERAQVAQSSSIVLGLLLIADLLAVLVFKRAEE